jgi:hypothetical protein
VLLAHCVGTSLIMATPDRNRFLPEAQPFGRKSQRLRTAELVEDRRRAEETQMMAGDMAR